MLLTRLNLQRTLTTSIWIAVVFAILICPFSVNTSTETVSGHHGNADNTISVTHASHVKEMALRSVESGSLASLILLVSFLVACGTTFFANNKDYAVPNRLFARTRYYLARKRDFFYLAKKEIYSWLSLFERAPNFIKAA